MKEFLICIDSDGTAIDSMTIKHRRCFAPALIDIWDLKENADHVISLWEEINLYSATRGINRFLGLRNILSVVNSGIKRINGLDEYTRWCEKTMFLSEHQLEIDMIPGNECMQKALLWSREVNGRIAQLEPNDKPAFFGVKDVLEKVYDKADIAIVSSADCDSVVNEWKYNGIYGFVSYVMTQKDGSKKDCIRKLLEKGYDKKKTIMLGDAVGDRNAAASCEIMFFPIVPRRENESWRVFESQAVRQFFDGEYGAYQEQYISDFLRTLNH